MTGHERRKEEKKNVIIRTAIELFKKHGFKKVAVSEIAENAGVSQVTIYKYFSNKHLLIRECMKEYLHNKAREYAEILQSDRPFQERLETVLKDKLSTMDNFDNELINELKEQDPEYIREIRSIRRGAIYDGSIPFFEEGREKGFIPSDISIDAILVFIDVVGAGILNSPIYHQYEEQNSLAFKEIQDIAVRCLTK